MCNGVVDVNLYFMIFLVMYVVNILIIKDISAVL